MTSEQIQQERDAADLKRHQERIVWLSEEAPVWGCGTPMSKFDQRELLRLSRNWIAEYERGQTFLAQTKSRLAA